MGGLRGAVALLLIAAGAGCAGRPAEGPGSAPSAARASSAAAASPAGSTASASAPGTASGSARPEAPSSAPGAAGLVPPLSAKARAAGLIDVRTVVADALVDLRYATSDNFVGVPLYPAGARCLVHESLAPGLATAADRLRRQGAVLVFWDCYRPHAAQVRMFDVVANPDWVARPGPLAFSHEAGRSVDVTLASAAPSRQCPAAQLLQRRCLLDMGTGFDDFSPRAHAFATDGVSSQAQSDRTRLRAAMSAGGITVYSGEWWHFNGPGAATRRPHLDAPLG
jgi:zinc D-Ala-D-Ala dipeptidase